MENTTIVVFSQHDKYQTSYLDPCKILLEIYYRKREGSLYVSRRNRLRACKKQNKTVIQMVQIVWEYSFFWCWIVSWFFVQKVGLDFLDFAFEFFDGFFCVQRFYFQGVEFIGCSQFEFYGVFQSFDLAVLCVFTHFNEFFHFKDFGWHV